MSYSEFQNIPTFSLVWNQQLTSISNISWLQLIVMNKENGRGR